MRRSFLRALIAAMPLVAVAFPQAAGAQTPPRKDPAVYTGAGTSRVGVPPPGIRLALSAPREFALASLTRRERERLGGHGPKLKVGVHRTLNADIRGTGDWQTTADGSNVWRMSVRSPGAAAIRVEFRNFAVGKGQVWLHDGVNVAGPYTGTGVFEDGHFWSDSVPSEFVIIEYQPAPDAPTGTTPPFEIAGVTHRQATVAAFQDGGAPNTADTCHLDPNCYPDWAPAISMIGQLDFVDGGDEFLCSGSAISTRDNSFKPYLLTAGHCINNEAAARTLQVFWTYQTKSCGGPAPYRSTSISSPAGAHLVDYGTIENGDYSLVLLQSIPSGVTFSGWDISDPPIGTALVGIHHPMGSWKRISFGQRVADQEVNVEGDDAPAAMYFHIQWNGGRTEPGSSGSPLFSSPGVITGTLTYGPYSPDLSACEITPAIDGYGRFSNAYPHLKTYLENLPTALVSPDRTSLSFSVAGHAAPTGQSFRLTTQDSSQITYKLRADAPWIQINSIAGTITSGSSAQIGVTIDPTKFDQPGQYTSTVTILSGAAAPQFVNISVTVTAPQSNVIESFTPGTVYQSAGQWSFQVTLAETGGVGTTVTSMKINGTDYSSNLASFFSGTHIPAKGSISAPLTAPSSFPSGQIYFEFSGVDDSTGAHWYRVAAVTLM